MGEDELEALFAQALESTSRKVRVPRPAPPEDDFDLDDLNIGDEDSIHIHIDETEDVREDIARLFGSTATDPGIDDGDLVLPALGAFDDELDDDLPEADEILATLDGLEPVAPPQEDEEDFDELDRELQAALADEAVQRFSRIVLVGYSLGGNILLKHLGESGLDSNLQGAAAVSVPFRLDECADRIGLGFSRVYQRHFMREMLGYIKDKQRRFQHEGLSDGLAELAALGSLKNLRTFWEFDGRVTAPLNGFVDAHDYYRRASSRYFLGAIRTPTLLVQSLDDPFVFKHSLPDAGELSASTRFDLQTHGGHVGFVGGTIRTPSYYLEQRIPAWLLDVHGAQTHL